MAELLFVFYLTSGLIKQILSYSPFPLLNIDLTLGTLIILFLYCIFHPAKFTTQISSKEKNIIFIFLAFWCWCIFTTVYSSSRSYCFTKSILISTDLVPLIFISTYKKFNIKKFIVIFSIFIIIISIIFIPLFIYKLKTGYDQDFQKFIACYLAISTNLGIIIIYNITAYNKIFKRNYLNIFFTIFLFALLCLLGGKGPLIFVIICSLIYFIVKFNYNKWYYLNKSSFKLILGGLLLLGFFSIFFINAENENLLLERTITRLTNIGTDNSTLERIDFIRFSLNTIFESPLNLFFGKGIGSFGYEYTGFDQIAYPHNFILEIVFETGLVGLILFVAFLCYCLQGKGERRYISIFCVLYIILNMLKSMSLEGLRIPLTFIYIYGIYKNLMSHKTNFPIKLYFK